MKKILYNIKRLEVIKTNIQQKINLACTYKGISQAELARGIDTSPSAFNQRMKTGKFTSEELKKIASFLGCKYSFSFEFPDGTTF